MSAKSAELKSEVVKTPKYVEMAEQVREQIINGELKPGDRLPSFAKMRADYGIGQGTLERVHQFLEQEGLIVREPNKGIFVAGRQRHIVGRGIGLLLQTWDETHPYIIHLLAGIRAQVKELGLELMLLNDKESIRWEKVSGVVLYLSLEEHVQIHLPPGMPGVTLLKAFEDLPYVAADDFEGTFSATRYLLELGHRRIAYMLASDYDQFSQRRLAGYRAALHEAGITPDDSWLHFIGKRAVPHYRTIGETNMRGWLQSGWRDLGCTALLAPNDEAAVGIIKALGEVGLRVPDDVTVIGFDGTEVSEFCTPGLTTVKVPLYEIGARAVELLWSQMQEDPAKPQSVELPTKIIVRESSAALG